MKATATVIAALGLGLGFACSSTTQGTGAPGSSSTSTSSSSGDAVTNDECKRRCIIKLAGCTASTAAGASDTCTQLCTGSFTSGQLTCLESKSCTQLASASSFEAICPRGGGSTTSTSSSGSGGSCTDYLDCKGIAYCTCPEGQQVGLWDCVSNTCVADCTTACQ